MTEIPNPANIPNTVELANAKFDGHLIGMMGKPKTAEMVKEITLRVSNANAAGNLRDGVRQAYAAWCDLSVVAAPSKPAKHHHGRQHKPKHAKPAALVAQPAQAVPVDPVVFVIELMMKPKLESRAREIYRRINELKAKGPLNGVVREAFDIWRKVSKGGVVSKDAPSASTAASVVQDVTPAMDASPVSLDVVIPLRPARTDGPEVADREEKLGPHRRPGSSKALKAKKDRQPRSTKGRLERKPKVEKDPSLSTRKPIGPAFVRFVSTHPEGEPSYSPFAAALAALAGQGESVAA